MAYGGWGSEFPDKYARNAPIPGRMQPCDAARMTLSTPISPHRRGPRGHGLSPQGGVPPVPARPRWRGCQPLVAVDASVLVHSHLEDSPHHAVASPLIERLCRSPMAWAIPWPSLHEFLVMATHPRGSGTPTTLAQAFAAVERWQAAGNLHLLGENAGYLEKLHAEAVASDARGARLYDARIATLCVRHGVRELWSAERGFRRFPRLVVRNPLEKAPPGRRLS